MSTPLQRRPYSLAHLTALHLNPVQMIHAAHTAGYNCVGLRLLPVAVGAVHYPLHLDAAMMRETKAAMAATGVQVFDLEIIRLNASFNAHDYLAFFDADAQLGARAMLVANDEPDLMRAADHYAALCEVSAPFGLTADLEPMPWTQMRNIDKATQMIRTAGTPNNAGILLDALNLFRATGKYANTMADVAAIPREWLHYAQICDAPATIPATTQALIFDARSNRLLPGEGGLDLIGLWDVLPRDLPLSLEIPNDIRRNAMGDDAWISVVIDAMRAILSE